MASRPMLEYNMAEAIEKLIRETTAVSTVSTERILTLHGLAEDARIMREAVLDYESTSTSAASTTGSLTSEPEPSGLGPRLGSARTRPELHSSESSDASDVSGSSKSTGRYYDPSETSDSGGSDALGIREAARAMREIGYNNISDNAFMRILENLVMTLRTWLMELEEAKYPSIDFDAPPKRWTKNEKITLRAEIREMSYEIRKKFVLDKMVELNKRRTSTGQTQETKLAVEMIELLLQDIFLLRVMPFQDVVFPIHMEKVYDWERVSAAINRTHNPAECQEAWFTKFHPDINRKAWSKAENKELSSLADSHNLHHWEQIAKQMHTTRSGFQCYVQYRRFLYKDKPVVLKLSQPPKATANGQKDEKEA